MRSWVAVCTVCSHEVHAGTYAGREVEMEAHYAATGHARYAVG